MRKVLEINESGLYVGDVILHRDEVTPNNCIEVPCVGVFYRPKWNGDEWVEGLSQPEIDTIKANQPIDAKTQAIAEIEKATTIASLKSAMLKFVNAN